MTLVSSRRDFLAAGVVGALGLTLDQFFRLQAATPAKAGQKGPPAESIIHIFLPGGIAHQDFVDPKPLAPIEYRGEMGTVKTKLPGVLFNQHMARTAQVADQITVCRGMTHGEGPPTSAARTTCSPATGPARP